jgi:hypothetical protein
MISGVPLKAAASGNVETTTAAKLGAAIPSRRAMMTILSRHRG